MAATIVDLFEEIKIVRQKLDDLAIRLITGDQISAPSGLSEISISLGLVSAGEFRTGNNLVPGEGFGGVRIGFPGFHYPSTSTADSDLYNVVGVDADTLQFGLRASDGVAVFGGGNVTLDVLGVNHVQGVGAANAEKWYTSSDELMMALYGYISGGATVISEWSIYSGAFGSASTDHLRVETYSDTDLARFSVTANEVLLFRAFRNELSGFNRIDMFAPTASFGPASGVINIANAAVAPSTASTDLPAAASGFLYVSSGDLVYLGPGGTQTVIALS